MIDIRQFREDDYDGAVAVWTAAGRDVVPLSELAIRPSLVLVADAAGEVAGVVMGTYDGRRGWIHRLAVDPARRRQGIATLLVQVLEERFAALLPEAGR